MLPCSGCPFCVHGLTSRFGLRRCSYSCRGAAALSALLLLGAEGKDSRLSAGQRIRHGPSPDGSDAWQTLRLRVCLVCGLASQLPSLIAYKRKSFEFKESNHCSCYEATIWKAFVDCLLKDSSVPFHTSLSHCVTFSVLSFFFFILLAHATVKLQVQQSTIWQDSFSLKWSRGCGRRSVFYVSAFLHLYHSVLSLLLVNQILRKNLQN